jgi:protein gp37
MSDKTGIQWTDATWNPVSGCSKVSPGCKNCYAERDWARLSKNPKSPYFGRAFTDVKCHPERLDQPLRWRAPRKIFVNSMSDLFHEDVPFEFIDRVFAVMCLARHHTFQVLTKRPERMREYLSEPARLDCIFDTEEWLNETGLLAATSEAATPGTWRAQSLESSDGTWLGAPDNVWLGISAENQHTLDARIQELLVTPAAVRFVSLEPLLEPIDLGPIHVHGDTQIQWVIVGGESGPEARLCDINWIFPVFVKQLGARPLTNYGSWSDGKLLKLRDRHGGDIDEWPKDLRIREFPR